MKSDWWGHSRLFLTQVLQEAKKVVWPTRRDVVLTSIIVFVLAMIVALFLMVVDGLLIQVLSMILGGGHD